MSSKILPSPQIFSALQLLLQKCKSALLLWKKGEIGFELLRYSSFQRKGLHHNRDKKIKKTDCFENIFSLQQKETFKKLGGSELP